MTLHERALAFKNNFPNPASWLWVTREQDRNVLYGIWVIGALYANATPYYGAFPRTFLDRLMALFPDMGPHDILHVFSGSLPAGPYTRVDCNPLLEPDVVGDVLEVKALFADRAPFGLVIADPPYSDDDAKKYQVVMIDRGKVTRALAEVVRPGGYLAWIDCVWPMHTKDQWVTVGRVLVQRSTNHRVRVLSLFERVA